MHQAGRVTAYYLACGDDPPLFLRNPTGRADGKTILYGKQVGEGSDLMIDNFR